MNTVPQAEDDVTATSEPDASRPGLFARLRGYAWDWRAVVAVGIATFIMGGLAGLAVGLSMDHGRYHRDHRDRFGPGGQFQRGGFPGGQFPGGQAPGQGFGPGNGQAPNGG